MELFNGFDRAGDGVDDHPWVLTLLPFGDLCPVGVCGALEFASIDQPETAGGILAEAPALQVKRYWWRRDIPAMHYSPASPDVSVSGVPRTVSAGARKLRLHHGHGIRTDRPLQQRSLPDLQIPALASLP
jgi:hypothetical protein